MSAYNKLFLVQEHYFAADCEVTDTDKGHDNIHTVYTTGTVVLFVCSFKCSMLKSRIKSEKTLLESKGQRTSRTNHAALHGSVLLTTTWTGRLG